MAEAYRKRQYSKHFLSKISDCDAENNETQTWIRFAFECGYIKKEKESELITKSTEVGKMINHMMNYPEKFGVKPN